MVEAALRVPIAQTGPPARLVRDVVLEISSTCGPPAAGPGARGVSDLGQMAEHDPRVVTPGLVPVVAFADGDRPDLDKQVPLPGDAGGEPPDAVAAWRAGLAGGGEGEPGLTGRVRPSGHARFVPFGGAGGCGSGAAVADGAALAVGDGHAPGGARVTGRGPSQLPGQVGVNRPDPGNLTGPVRQVQQGGRRDGQGDPPREPG